MFSKWKDTTKVIGLIIGFFIAVTGGCEAVKYRQFLLDQKAIESEEIINSTSVFDTTYTDTFTVMPFSAPVETVQIFAIPDGFKLVPSDQAPETVTVIKYVDRPAIADTINHPFITIKDQAVKDTVPMTTMQYYSDVFQDSSLSIYYHAAVKGTLEDIQLSYKSNLPETITETVYERVEVIKPIYPDLTEFFLGGGLIGGDDFAGFSVGASIKTKKNVLVGYEYDLVNKQHAINFKYRIFKMR